MEVKEEWEEGPACLWEAEILSHESLQHPSSFSFPSFFSLILLFFSYSFFRRYIALFFVFSYLFLFRFTRAVRLTIICRAGRIYNDVMTVIVRSIFLEMQGKAKKKKNRKKKKKNKKKTFDMAKYRAHTRPKERNPSIRFPTICALHRRQDILSLRPLRMNVTLNSLL